MIKFLIVWRTLFMVFIAAIGAVFLWLGIGGVLSMAEYKGLKGYGIPVGLLVILLAVLIPKFWPISGGWDTETQTADSPTKPIEDLKPPPPPKENGAIGGHPGYRTKSGAWIKTIRRPAELDD